MFINLYATCSDRDTATTLQILIFVDLWYIWNNSLPQSFSTHKNNLFLRKHIFISGYYIQTYNDEVTVNFKLTCYDNNGNIFVLLSFGEGNSNIMERLTIEINTKAKLLFKFKNTDRRLNHTGRMLTQCMSSTCLYNSRRAMWVAGNWLQNTLKKERKIICHLIC